MRGAPEKSMVTRRVLIVPDKFKGTLAAPDVCAAIAKGWQSVRPRDRMELLPMSDGGDGFGAVMGELLSARRRSVPTLDAAHRPVSARWWWQPEEKLAVIEAARVIGLALLPPGKFHPFALDTFGLGRVLAAASRAGAGRCVVGIGGSATNDAGFGLARALGWKFYDRAGTELDQWWQAIHLHRITSPRQPCNLSLTVAVDVSNPLLGPRGCTRVYGPQKGLRPEEMAFAEKCLRRLSAVMEKQCGRALAAIPGAGAAGGLGFGLMAFAGAKAASGFDVFAGAAQLAARIRHADLVITGEGAVDRQSFMGKGVGRVAELCRRLEVPCVALAGVVNAPAAAARFFARSAALTDLVTPDDARSRPQFHLQRLSAELAKNIERSTFNPKT
jgi:glycerate kinase